MFSSLVAMRSVEDPDGELLAERIEEEMLEMDVNQVFLLSNSDHLEIKL